MKRFPKSLTAILFYLVLSSALFAVPRITVDPLQIGNELFTGEDLVYDIEIGNEGDDQLQFAIEIEYLGHIVKDSFGRFYYPRYNHYNNIPFWDFRQAYQLKMAEAEDFTMTGEAIPVDTPFDLSAG